MWERGTGGGEKEPQPTILFLCDVNVAAGGHVDLYLPHSTHHSSGICAASLSDATRVECSFSFFIGISTLEDVDYCAVSKPRAPVIQWRDAIFQNSKYLYYTPKIA